MQLSLHTALHERYEIFEALFLFKWRSFRLIPSYLLFCICTWHLEQVGFLFSLDISCVNPLAFLFYFSNVFNEVHFYVLISSTDQAMLP